MSGLDDDVQEMPRQQSERVGMTTDTTDPSLINDPKMFEPPSLRRMWIAEAIGSFIFIFFGIGSVTASVCTGALTGLWQVAVIWGFGLTLAIYAVASVSEAHLNPAVTFTHMILRRNVYTVRRGLIYMSAQFFGGFVAGLVNLIIFDDAIRHFENKTGLVRGELLSERSAMVFGMYFPNPGIFIALDHKHDGSSIISHAGAFFVEAFGTAMLVFMIFALTSNRNYTLGSKDMAPYFIGFTVASLISVLAPLTQGGFNPARDFGPRLIAAMAGWGEVAIPGPRKGCWVYWIAPMIGGPIGGILYEVLLKPRLIVSHGDPSAHSGGLGKLRAMIPI